MVSGGRMVCLDFRRVAPVTVISGPSFLPPSRVSPGGRSESTPRATKTCGVEAYRVLKTSLMIADRWGSPGRTTELAQAVLCWASHRGVGGQVQCASRRACPINIQQQQWCWSYAAGWCLCRHAQNSQTVHSVPSATGSCAEDGDLVAGAIGGARHRTDQ